MLMIIQFNWSENIIVDRFYSEFDQEQIDLLLHQKILVIPLNLEDTFNNGNFRVFSIDNVVIMI